MNFFLQLDATKRFRGLIYGFSRNLHIQNSFSSSFVLGVEVYNFEVDKRFLILNIYGAYDDRLEFWISLLSCGFYKIDNLIFGENMNVTWKWKKF